MTKTDEIIEGLSQLQVRFTRLMGASGLPEAGKINSIQAAIDHLKAMQWVSIAELPEEWKDGRPVDLLVRFQSKTLKGEYVNTIADIDLTSRCPAMKFKNGIWTGINAPQEFEEYVTDEGVSCDKSEAYHWRRKTITHAMLPIAPPALGKPEE